MIRAIETIYQGYRFRSRLEARWAVYFDTCGIEWEYEPEGFDLGDAGAYLPDFWLPKLDMWAEVKREPFSDEEQRKCEQLAIQSGFSVLQLIGVPADRFYPLVRKTCEFSFPDDGECGVNFVVTTSPYAVTNHPGSGRLLWSSPRKETPSAEGMMTYEAYLGIFSAKSARFEHGETPKVTQ